MLLNFLKIIIVCLIIPLNLAAQGDISTHKSISEDTVNSEQMISVSLNPIVVFPRAIDTRRYARLIHNIKVVYPIAQQAKMLLDQTEKSLLEMDSRSEQKAFVKQMEQDLKETYTPILKRMTYSQGRVLLKLIDRQTSHTSYDLVRELRGSFSAFFWQGVARIFGADLKMEYDAEGEDKEIERLIRLYELGLI